jgi:hypothetical protein
MDNSKAREILEKKIAAGRASARDLFERVHEQAPRDHVVRGRALTFSPSDKTGVLLGAGLEAFEGSVIHRHALSQLASRASVPAAYMHELSESNELWKRTLAAEILTRHYHQGSPLTRYLVRRTNSDVRGFLSDKYRRLDSRPLVEAFAKECAGVGAEPIDGLVTDTRVALKAIVPTVFEPVPGEAMAFGIEWSNSDFGNGTHSVRAFIFRLWCANGATMENALSQVHLGRVLSDDIELSERTYNLDTKASISALQDVVKGTLAPKKLGELMDGIRAADANKVEWRHATTKLAKRLLKGELEAAKAAFESDDVINLPEGKSLWRVSNALSWIAGRTEDPERKLDLQRLAGEVLRGKKEEEMAEAA